MFIYNLCFLYLPHVNNATDTVTLLHGLESLIDAIEVLSVSDELINLQLALHVIIDQVGKLRTALDTSECTSLEMIVR
jgi:hypothetical protein